MESIDITFDYRKDSKCGDPDTDSQKLYSAHKKLWNKVLPSGKMLEINIINDQYGRLLLKNNQYMNFSSDRMCPHFDGKYNGLFNGWLNSEEIELLKNRVRTIGGHIVFPAHKKDGFTINQARGVNRNIGDRFDLTLECIRRFYKNEKSPLYNALNRYKDFFDLFVDFKEYVDFFLLQDFINAQNKIEFALPFEDFIRSPLPQNSDEYRQYKDKTIEVIEKRNGRISLNVK
jgi:hypothetical protein